MRYYAANNQYGSETDLGFSNTWYVLAFESKAARDGYVNKSMSLAAHAIKRSEVKRYMNKKPKPFSGYRYSIVENNIDIDGCLGEISVSRQGKCGYIEDFR